MFVIVTKNDLNMYMKIYQQHKKKKYATEILSLYFSKKG